MFRALSKIIGICSISTASLLFLAANVSAQNAAAEKIFQSVKQNILQIGNAKCVSEMSRAIALDKTQAEYYNYRGFCYSLLDKDKEALADLDEALRLNPGLIEALFSRSYLFSKTDKLKAIPDLKRIVEIDPKKSNAYGMLATYYLDLAKYDDAFAMGQKVNELVPEGGAGYRYQAQALAGLGKYTEAIPLYSEALKRDDQDTHALEGRADAYRHVGNTAAAKADEQAAANLPKNSSGYGNGRGTGGGIGAGSGRPPMVYNPETTGGSIGPGEATDPAENSESAKPASTVKIEPLQITKRPRAEYTEEARHANVQGTVLLQIAFLANGTIGPIRVISRLPNGLTEKAIEAAKLIEFKPELRDGVPVTTYKNLRYSFTIY